MKLFSLTTVVSLAFVSSSLLLTTGCGVAPTEMAADVASPGASLEGTVYGGQQPITGAHLYLFAANTTGYGSASISLISKNFAGNDTRGNYVVTDSGGYFNLTNTYSCTPGQQVYLASYGGNPGLTAGTNNTAATLVAVLGTCPSDSTFAGHIAGINLNEVSSVAAAFSLAGYATDFTHVSSTNTTAAVAGIATAFLTGSNMVSLVGGGAYATTPAIGGYSGSLSANGTVPQSKINTLADIMASCVNTSAGTSPACSTLFTDTTYTAIGASSQTVPATTFDAMLSIAKNPGNKVSQLFALNSSTAPFNPQLKTAPNDWTVAIKFSAPNSSVPGRAVVDSLGNIWISNTGNSTLTKLSPMGAVMSGTGGFSGGGMNQPIGMAFDATGNIYVTGLNTGVISKFSSAGVALSSTGYATANNNAGYGVTFDPTTGYLWMSGSNAINQLSTSGTGMNSYTGNSYNTGVVEDASGAFWSTSYTNNALTKYTSGVPANYYGGGLASPADIAMDASGTSWISNCGGNVVSHFSKTGTAVSSTGYSVGGINAPYAIAVDGQNIVWVGNSNGTISELSNAGAAMSPSTGFSTAITNAAGTTTSSTNIIYGITPDPAGNLWVSDTDGSIYEFIGIASPINGATKPSQAGTRP